MKVYDESGFKSYIFGNSNDEYKEELERDGLLDEYNSKGWGNYPFFFYSLEYDPNNPTESRNSIELYILDMYDPSQPPPEIVTKSVSITFSKEIK